MQWENLKSLLEILIIPIILVFFETRKSLKERQADAVGSVLVKETTDKTEITTLLLNQGQERYKDLIVEIDNIRNELDKVQKTAQRLLVENLYLRNMLKIGPDDHIPGMRRAMEEDARNALNTSDSSDEQA